MIKPGFRRLAGRNEVVTYVQRFICTVVKPQINFKQMKKLLDYQSRDVANIFDEVTLWSAPFGRLLLENIPMKPKAKIVDIGFGTGFPLIELSQRFGDQSQIIGIDIWQEGIHRTTFKMNTLEISNIEIIEESATEIKIADHQIDLVTSNLGVNNFEEKDKVYKEIKRILKEDGRLCITTNPIGTFEELFGLFNVILSDMNLEKEQILLSNYLERRNTKQQIISEFETSGFKLLNEKFDSTNIRFVDAEAVLNHSLMRIGFRASWEEMIRKDKRNVFFNLLKTKINNIIDSKGEFCTTIPMLYLEFGKA